MARFRMRQTVEAITFDELVAIGREQNPGRIGMPWSFAYQGKPITHENDDCYLVPGAAGWTQRLTRGCRLVTLPGGDLFVVKPEDFETNYEAVAATRADIEKARADVRDSLHRLIAINGADGTAAAEYIVLADVENLVSVAARKQVTPCAATPCPFEGAVEVIKGSGDRHCDYHAHQLRTLLGERFLFGEGRNTCRPR